MAAYDRGTGGGEAFLDSVHDGKAVTPSDSADLPNGACRALWIEGSGTLRITTLGGTVKNFTAAQLKLAPDFHLWGAKRVHSTGTSATGIYAIY